MCDGYVMHVNHVHMHDVCSSYTDQVFVESVLNRKLASVMIHPSQLGHLLPSSAV